jgi:MFS transporter, DHA2 family, multidrug resistance protein
MSAVLTSPASDSTRTGTTSAVPNSAVDKKTWVAVIGACFGAFLAILNIQVVSSSLADIQGAIGTGAEEGGWIVTAYLVAEIIIIPMSGWLARILSLRTYLLASTFFFLVLTVACAFTSNLGQMIVVRALQGLAGGALIPLAFSIIMTRLPPSKHAIGLTIYTVSAIFAPSIGPVIGGYCNDTFGWQSIFYVSVLPGAVMFAMLWFSLDPAPRQLGELRRGDWLGIATIAISLGALETVLEEGNKNDWFGTPWILKLSIVAAVSMVLFTIIELIRKSPLLHLRLFARRNFGLASIANFFFGLSMYGWIYIVPLYLSRIQGYDAEQIGEVLVWIGLPQLLILPMLPKVIKIVAPKYLVIAGYILFIFGSLLATHLSDDFSGPQFMASSLVRAIAQSMVMMPLSAIAVAGIEHEYAGSASAMFNMVRNLGGAIGIAALQTFLTKREEFHSDILTSQVSLLGEAARARLAHLTGFFMERLSADPELARHEAAIAVGRVLHREATIMAFDDTVLLQSALLGFALIGIFFLKKGAIKAGGEAH